MERRNVTAPGLVKPKGYEDAVLCGAAQKILFLGGHVAFDQNRKILHPGDLVAQMRVALRNLRTTLDEAELDVTDIVKLTIHVIDVDSYRQKLPELGKVWHEVLGKFYPAMTLLGVAGLMEPGCVVEIDGIAAR